MRSSVAFLILAAATLAGEDVYVPSFDGTFVAAALRKPAGNGPFPAVILLHGGVGGFGFEGARRFVEGPVPDRFLELNYVVMASDYRRYHFGEDEARDVIAAYRKLAAFPYVDGNRIGLIGGSHGGYLAELVATRIKPAAIVSYGGGTDIEATMFDLAQKLRPSFRSYDEWLQKLLNAKKVDVELPLEMAWRFGGDRDLYRNVSPKSQASKITSPVLFVMAGKDLPVSKEAAQWLVNYLKGRGVPAEYNEFAGMQHVFSWGRGDIRQTPEFRESLKLSTDFLEKYVKGSAP